MVTSQRPPDSHEGQAMTCYLAPGPAPKRIDGRIVQPWGQATAHTQAAWPLAMALRHDHPITSRERNTPHDQHR
jgi:hypothetical protein